MNDGRWWAVSVFSFVWKNKGWLNYGESSIENLEYYLIDFFFFSDQVREPNKVPKHKPENFLGFRTIPKIDLNLFLDFSGPIPTPK